MTDWLTLKKLKSGEKTFLKLRLFADFRPLKRNSKQWAKSQAIIFMGCQHDFPFLGSTRWLQPIVKPKNRSTIQIISMLSDKRKTAWLNGGEERWFLF